MKWDNRHESGENRLQLSVEVLMYRVFPTRVRSWESAGQYFCNPVECWLDG